MTVRVAGADWDCLDMFSNKASTSAITLSGVDVPAVIPTVKLSENHSAHKSDAVCT